MSVFDGLFRSRRKVKLTDPAGWVFEAGSNAGKAVTQDTTLSLSTAWACVRLRSRVAGALGLGVYERGPGGERILARNHWLYRLVHDSPNADQTPAEFWAGMVAAIDLWGNAYARIERAGGGRIVALTPLRPDLMTVRRDANGVRVYTYEGAPIAEADVLHLRGFTLGGDVGLSAISYGRHSLGLGLAADETAAKTFANGLQISGFIEMALGVRLDEPQRNQLIELFAKFTGSSRAGKVMPLDGGMKFVPLNMSPADAQLLQSRQFNIEEICRWFDTPPILIGHAAQGQTMWGSGIEQIMLGWLTLSLDPLLTGIQQAVGKQLLSPAERGRYYAEFNREAVLRADSEGRAEFYSKIFQVGAISPNQIADRENLPRFEGGDRRFVNSTYVPIDQAGQQPSTRPPAGQS